MKIMIVLGTRPEIIRLSRTITRLREWMECTVVHTGQNYSHELSDIFYDDLGIAPPDYYLDAVGSTLAETLGNIIIKTDQVLEKINPDALLVLGDTNSALSVIPAKRRKIPIFHYEAGNRCFDQRVPEEINRKIVDHTSDINLTYSGIAKENLLREGFPMDRVFNIGSPMYEILDSYSDKIDKSDIIERLELKEGKYFILSAHREENVDSKEKMLQLFSSLKAVQEQYGMPIVFSIHPRTELRLNQFGLKLQDGFIKSKPFNFTDYIALQKKAFCVLSDSGTITEESSILGFPAINIRETHERLEGMEKTAVTMTGFDSERILSGINICEQQRRGGKILTNYVDDYMQKNISEKIVKIILSYTDYVNKRVWFK
jgi:UDP-N-acetylglucosamine 2-epimerase (non-hydrolysing)